jgi:hypothetical protein
MIDPAVEFRRQAVLCRRMAREALDLESRGGWNRLADRWTRCAELEEARPAPERRHPRYRHDERQIYRNAS